MDPTSPDAARASRSGATDTRTSGTATAGADWVIGRNPVLEALQAGLPVRRAYVADGVERDDRLRDILRFAADNGIPLLQATRTELDRLTGGGVHQGIALQLPAFEYADADDCWPTRSTPPPRGWSSRVTRSPIRATWARSSAARPLSARTG